MPSSSGAKAAPASTKKPRARKDDGDHRHGRHGHHGSGRTGIPFALPPLHGGGMGTAARGHAAAAFRKGTRGAEGLRRAHLARRSVGNLPAAVAGFLSFIWGGGGNPQSHPTSFFL